MDVFLEDHKNFLLLLLKHKVDFLLIGGYAVIYHGYQRPTGDMDIWLKPDNENREKFIAVLREHNIPEKNLAHVHSLDFNNVQVMHIGEKPNKIDFLTKVSGLTFDEAYKKKVFLPLKDKTVPVVHYHHLIVLKMIAGRPQDKADIDILQKINQFKKKG